MAEKTMIMGTLFLAAIVVVPTGTANNIETKDICSKIPATKLGLWGGNEGMLKDIPEAPKRLENITIISNYSIDSLEFTYIDQTGQKRSAGRWGGPRGTAHKLDLGPTEIVKEVSGTYDRFEGETCLTSFKLVTNARTWGPWAEEKGTPFSITAPTGTSIVGFFGRGGIQYLAAIGVYLNKL